MFRSTNPFRNDTPAAEIARDKQTYMPPQIELAAPASSNRSQPGTVYTSGQAVAREDKSGTQWPLPTSPTPSPVVSSDAPAPGPEAEYNFITDTAPSPPQPLWNRLPGGNSLPVRMLFVAGSLIVLMILFSIIRGALSGGDKFAPFVSVVQEQQELLHLTSAAGTKSDLPPATQNFVATAQSSISSSQSRTITYLAQNKKKIKPKALNLKVSPTTDSQLDAAAEAGTYNQAFKEVMQAKLKTYSNTLAQTYAAYKGQKGRALLQDSYQQAQLLQVQLTAAN